MNNNNNNSNTNPNISLPSIDTSFSNLSFNGSVIRNDKRNQQYNQPTMMSSPTHKNLQFNPYAHHQSHSLYQEGNATVESVEGADYSMNQMLNTPTTNQTPGGVSNYWNQRNITAPIMGVTNSTMPIQRSNQQQTAETQRMISGAFADHSFMDNASMNHDLSMSQTQTPLSPYKPAVFGQPELKNTYHSQNTKTNNNQYENVMQGDKNKSNKHLETQLKIKDSQIDSLEQEIQTLKKFLKKRAGSANVSSSSLNTTPSSASTAVSNMDSIPNYKHNNNLTNRMSEQEENEYKAVLQKIEDEETYVFPVLPKNVETIVNRLASKLLHKDKELQETNDRLETLITAVVSNPSPSMMNPSLSNVSTKYGRYDVETLAHKMVVRLEMLTRENQEMAKMLSYGRSKEYQIELNLLRKENKGLKERVAVLEDAKTSNQEK
ncbi:hypothetical protein ACO0RG_000531 [Hanseniaspora osmophila]